MPWLSHDFPCQVVQGNVDGCFGGRIVFGNFIYMGKDVFQVKRVGKPVEVYFFQKVHYRRLCFAQIGRKGCFAIAGDTVVFDFRKHHRRGGAGGIGDSKHMPQL